MTEFQLRFCPAHYLHMTHCPEVLGQAIQALPHWRESGAVNGWLISVLELSEPFDMPGRLGRLALFAQPALEQVLSSLGGCCTARPSSRYSIARAIRACGWRWTRGAFAIAWNSGAWSSALGLPTGNRRCQTVSWTRTCVVVAWRSGYRPAGRSIRGSRDAWLFACQACQACQLGRWMMNNAAWPAFFA